MRKLSRTALITIIMAMVFCWGQEACFADTYEFDPQEQSHNPFNPRGYMIEISGRQAKWISSPFDNSGTMPKYIGNLSGLDYVDAEKAGLLYALTDRHPTNGKQFLSAFKNGAPIHNFSSYIGEESKANIATTGSSTGWKIPIDMKLEPGCRYEFAFLRGLTANNGITLVFSEDGKGYIRNRFTVAENAKYDRDKFEEYEFIVSYKKDKNPETNENHYYDFYMVPMRFTVQTYADMDVWEKAAAKADKFLASVTAQDYREGRYKRSNVTALKEELASLKQKAKKTVRKELQPSADKMMAEMVKQLNALLEKAKSEKPEPADLSRLTAILKEAQALYEKASGNTGTDIGQYGAVETQNLGDEIAAAQEMDRFTPQNEIDAEVDALESAMLEVKKSRRVEDALYFYDKATGIYIIAPAGSLPADAKLYVRRMSSDTQAYQAMEKNLSQQETEAILYNIQFYQDEFKIQPKQQVEVQMPIDNRISQKSSIVYAAGKNGALKKITSVIASGTQIFKDRKLGNIVLAGSAATAEEKAQARGDRMRQIMAQQQEKNAENKTQELAAAKKKKEEYKEPLDNMLKRSANAATFSNDVRRKTNPGYLIFLAAALGLAAVAMGIRGLRESRKKEIS